MEVQGQSGTILNHFRRFRLNFIVSDLCWVMLHQLFLKNSISYGSSGHPDTSKRLVTESSSLHLRAEKWDLSRVFAIKSHFLLNNDFAILRHMCMILPWLKNQNMIIIYEKHDYYIWEIQSLYDHSMWRFGYQQCRLSPKPGCWEIGFRQISLRIYILYHTRSP